MTNIFCELLSIKEPQTTLQNKKLQSHQKMPNQNTKKNRGIDFALFNCMGEMRMDNFGCLNSSLSFISVL